MNRANKIGKGERPVKFKIASGYVILLAAAILSAKYIYKEMTHVSSLENYESQLYTKYSFISRTLYHLNQVENYGQLILAGYISYDAPYKKEMDVVRSYIDSLRLLAIESADSMQSERIDSIGGLLTMKEQNILNLRNTIHAATTTQLYNKDIDSLLSTAILPSDMTLTADTTLLSPTEEQIVTQYDTIVTTRKNRPGFFRRLAQAFSSEQKDSTIVINTRIEQIQVQTPPPPAFSLDTITTLLRDLQGSVNTRSQEIYDKAWKTGNRLRHSNQLITEKISHLLFDFEREWTQYMLTRMESQRAVSQHAIQVLGGVAFLSIMLTLIFLFIIWRDIDRSNRQKRELEAANRYTEELLKIRENLMLTITHDIKAPLSSIMGYIDLLSRLTKDKREAAYLSNMNLSAHHLLRLVNDLLDFHRLDSNKMEVNRVTFHPATLFTHLLDSFRPVIEKKGIVLHNQIAAELNREMVSDPLRIRQVAENLLSNAVKFTDHGEIHFIASTDKTGRQLRFTVEDTGRGIAQEEQEKIYREFTRLPSAQGVEGFGLGLSITRKLIHLLGGSITLDSTPGKGSAFHVTLPIEPAPERKSPSLPDQATKAAGADLSGIRCLIIDDDRFQLEITQAMCRQLGFTADCCQHPAELDERLLSIGQYQAILTDIQMPAMSGFDVLHRIRAMQGGEKIPVIAVTARSDNSQEDFQQAGFSAVLTKPFSKTELTDCLRSVIPDRSIADAGEKTDVGEENASQAIESTSRFAALTAFAGEDQEAATEILRSFVSEGRINLQRLRTASTQHNAAELRAVAHKMLPIYRLLQAERIVILLSSLEQTSETISPEILSQAEEAAAAIEHCIENAENELSLS